MKLPVILSAMLLAIATSAVYAAENEPAKENAAMTETTTTKKVKKMKPHAHSMEKSGSPQEVTNQPTDHADPSKDKRRHIHSRDGK